MHMSIIKNSCCWSAYCTHFYLFAEPTFSLPCILSLWFPFQSHQIKGWNLLHQSGRFWLPVPKNVCSVYALDLCLKNFQQRQHLHWSNNLDQTMRGASQTGIILNVWGWMVWSFSGSWGFVRDWWKKKEWKIKAAEAAIFWLLVQSQAPETRDSADPL